jgi:hypothetical protein
MYLKEYRAIITAHTPPETARSTSRDLSPVDAPSAGQHWAAALVQPGMASKTHDRAALHTVQAISGAIKEASSSGEARLRGVLENAGYLHPVYLPLAVADVMRDPGMNWDCKDALLAALRTPINSFNLEVFGAAYGKVVARDEMSLNARLRYIYELRIDDKMHWRTKFAALLPILQRTGDPYTARSAAEAALHDGTIRSAFLIRCTTVWSELPEISRSAIINAVCPSEKSPALLTSASATALLRCCAHSRGMSALKLMGAFETDLCRYEMCIKQLGSRHADTEVSAAARASLGSRDNREAAAIATLRNAILSGADFRTADAQSAIGTLAECSNPRLLERLLLPPVTIRAALFENIAQLAPIFVACKQHGIEALAKLVGTSTSPGALYPYITEVLRAFPPHQLFPLWRG